MIDQLETPLSQRVTALTQSVTDTQYESQMLLGMTGCSGGIVLSAVALSNMTLA